MKAAFGTNNFSGEFMISTLPQSQSQSFEFNDVGLFEINDAGTILYYRPDNGKHPPASSAPIVGRNFFDEVSPFENTEELRQRFKLFIKSDCPTENFKFTCRMKNQIIPAKIMLVRITERADSRRAQTTIVDIRKIQLAAER